MRWQKIKINNKTSSRTRFPLLFVLDLPKGIFLCLKIQWPYFNFYISLQKICTWPNFESIGRKLKAVNRYLICWPLCLLMSLTCVLAFIRAFLVFCLLQVGIASKYFGPIILSMNHMMRDVLLFLITFTVIMLAFASGVSYIFNMASGKMQNSG